ncbi:hypothetical protein PVL29_016631 [Vitis rotundifolia]|uniref:Uncharacterized protein n=1 Tax=Vitis rotundifolia TaxID=103349 RepID=A0AA38Z898_VITRO|nr:hypothetical protein PVL29_016631 [Vitis rotundifolia]
MSPSTMSTVLRVQQRHRTLNPAITYSLHDNTSIGYEWLLPGWIAEQRTMPSGRVYRVDTDTRATENIILQYYYDPSGHLYRTKNEVLLAWEEAGIVVLDP